MFDWIILAIVVVWLTFAAICDIKTKEVPDWLNYSLIILGLAIYSFKSLQINSFTPILKSLAVFGIFFVISELMYYSKQWGGGDTKLLMGLGAILPEYPSQLISVFNPNLTLPFPMILFINILLIGGIYGLVMCLALILKNTKAFHKNFKELISQVNIKRLRLIILVLSLLFIILALIIKVYSLQLAFFFLAVFPFLFFYLYLSVKSIENISMYKILPTSKLVEGDWIAEDIKIKNKLIYSKKSLGVTKEQIELIKKHKKKVLVKDGIAFVPSFWIGTIISILFGNIIF